MSCEDCKAKVTENNEESFAMQLVKEYAKTSKRWFIVSLVILGMWLSTIFGFVWFIQLYDYTTYDIYSDGGGNANYQEGDNSAIYNN